LNKKELLDEFIAQSRELIGKEAEDRPHGNVQASRRAILRYNNAIGDGNALYNNPEYATDETRYEGILAPPTYLLAVRIPASEGAYLKKDYNLANFFGGAWFEWYNIIKLGDTLTSEIKLKDVYEKTNNKAQRTVVLVSEASYWNQHKELVARGGGAMVMKQLKERGETLFYDRPIHRYSEDEIKRIEQGVENESVRGSNPLYWEKVNVGAKLTPVVKGPLQIMPDMFQWHCATKWEYPMLEVAYRFARDNPGKRRLNLEMNWPYFTADQEYDDHQTAILRGMPHPFDIDGQRVGLTGHLLTNWMSDEGFLKNLKVEILEPFFYGDTLWIKGEVVDKYKEKIGGIMYRAVDVTIEIVNQLKDLTGKGTATVYLPSRGREVKIPIAS
jgi:acyl dehydratase